MTRRRIALALVGAVLVLLYVAAVARPAGDRPTTPQAAAQGPLRLLAELLGDRAAADPADLRARCREPDGRLWFEDSCTVEVAPAEGPVRLVPLHTAHSITVVAPAPAGDFTISTGADPGETVQVAVGARGATIEVRCEESDGCGVRIRDSDG